MSKPTTPLSRYLTASSAISSERAAVRMAVSSAYTRIGRFLLPAGEAVEDRLDHLVEGEAAFGVQLGGEADLGVDDAIGGQVLGALLGDPPQRVRSLHDADRVPERVQVQVQVAAVRAGGQHRRQLVRIVGRQAVVAGLPGELDDGFRAQAAVQVIVQQHLRHGADLVKCRAHLTYAPTSSATSAALITLTTSGVRGGGALPIVTAPAASSASSAGANRARRRRAARVWAARGGRGPLASRGSVRPRCG